MTPQQYTQQMTGDAPQGGLSNATRVPMLMGTHQNQQPQMPKLGLSLTNIVAGRVVLGIITIIGLRYWNSRAPTQAALITKWALPLSYGLTGYQLARI